MEPHSISCIFLCAFIWPIHFNRADQDQNCHLSQQMTGMFTFFSFVADLVEEAKVSIRKHTSSVDCASVDWKLSDNVIQRIRPWSRFINEPFDALCDPRDDGGGWTVFQRRGDFKSAQDYFYRDWDSYKKGFGDIRQDFWLGNDKIHALSNQRACELKIIMTDWEDKTTFASYDEFWIEDEAHNYTLHIGKYRGNSGDSLTQHNGFPFTTKDRKNDFHDTNCAVVFKGAWWHDKCHVSNLNGLYLKGAHESFANGVNWESNRGYKYSLKDTFMMIRPKNFQTT